MRAFFDHSEREAHNITSFWFKPEKSVVYIPGQFIELYVPHTNPDERGARRQFTLSSSPTEAPLISITTKFTSKKSSSFKEALRKLQPGDFVTISDSMGDFVLPKNPAIPLVFVAGGIGITPARSIIKFLLDSKENRTVHLLYSVSRFDELVFTPLFTQYSMKFIPVINKPPVGWKGKAGVLTGSRIIELADGILDKLIYLSGPEPMIEALWHDLQQLQVPTHQLITDFYSGYNEL